MADAADIEVLSGLHAQLKKSMERTDLLIRQLDQKLDETSGEWTSTGAHEFTQAWQNGFKPSLAKLCQALAAAGADVAFQHNQLVGDDEEGDDESQLEPLSSPR